MKAVAQQAGHLLANFTIDFPLFAFHQLGVLLAALVLKRRKANCDSVAYIKLIFLTFRLDGLAREQMLPLLYPF